MKKQLFGLLFVVMLVLAGCNVDGQFQIGQAPPADPVAVASGGCTPIQFNSGLDWQSVEVWDCHHYAKLDLHQGQAVEFINISGKKKRILWKGEEAGLEPGKTTLRGPGTIFIK